MHWCLQQLLQGQGMLMCNDVDEQLLLWLTIGSRTCSAKGRQMYTDMQHCCWASDMSYVLTACPCCTCHSPHSPDAPAAKPTGRTSNKLRAYAVDEAGTQGGLLPVLSELPQRGEQPSSRMYHRAAVDPGAGVMYVYGGVHVRDRDGARLPADQIAGVLHCYEFHSYTWTILQTSGG